MPSDHPLQVLLYKRDLRRQDHEPLRLALTLSTHLGPVLPLFIHEPSIVALPDYSAQHSGFLRETLDELSQELGRIGGALVEQIGEATEVLDRLWKVAPFERLWSYQESGTQATFARDKAIASWCRSRDVQWTEVPQNAVERGSSFADKGFQFREYLDAACAAEFFAPDNTACFAPVPKGLDPFDPAKAPVGCGNDKPGRLTGGRSEALRHLKDFVDVPRLLAYPNTISSPLTAEKGCSRLSPYLSFGILSDREVFQKLNNTVLRARKAQPPAMVSSLQSSVQFYADRLNWRCAYLQSFERRVESETQHDLVAFDGVREGEFNEKWFEAWVTGRTGYPMIDASMAMLAETGWINMRMRGMLTSFAVNELWLPYREVGLHLAREFLDYEPGIHWNQLQIHSGTSRLSAPLTYNAVKQAQDHDAQGLFVRRWLPALANVPTENIFEPWRMSEKIQVASGCLIGVDYPAPIVPHQAANDAARQRVAALREGRPQPNLAYMKKKDAEQALSKQESLF